MFCSDLVTVGMLSLLINALVILVLMDIPSKNTSRCLSGDELQKELVRSECVKD